MGSIAAELDNFTCRCVAAVCIGKCTYSAVGRGNVITLLKANIARICSVLLIE